MPILSLKLRICKFFFKIKKNNCLTVCLNNFWNIIKLFLIFFSQIFTSFVPNLNLNAGNLVLVSGIQFSVGCVGDTHFVPGLKQLFGTECWSGLRFFILNIFLKIYILHSDICNNASLYIINQYLSLNRNKYTKI